MGGRNVAVALDFSPSSRYALTWAVENLVRQGDHVLIIVVHKMELEDGTANVWEASGSPLVSLNDMKDPHIAKQYHLTHDSALVEELEAAAKAKHLTVTAKVYFGDARIKIAHAVVEQKIDALVMGNRGQGHFQRILLGSVSNYVVNNVPCPSIVVKLPEP